MADINTNNVIPTSASTFNIVQEEYKDLNNSIKYFSESGIKQKDLIRIKRSVKLSKKAITLIIDGYLELSTYISKEAGVTKNIMASIISDPILFIKSIKEKNSFIDLKKKNKLSVLDSYILILKLLKQISDFGNKVKLKNIKKIPKVTRSAMSAIVSALKIIGRRSKFFKAIEKSTEVIIFGLTNIFGSLMKMQGMLVEFAGNALSFSKMIKIRWAVRQLFVSFTYILVEIYKLGKFIRTGEYDDKDLKAFKFLKTTEKRKIKFEKEDLIKTLLYGAGVVIGVTTLMFLMSLMIPKMNIIGNLKNRFLLKHSLRQINTLFFGWDDDAEKQDDWGRLIPGKHNPGLVDMLHKIGSEPNILKESLNFAAVCASITVGIFAVSLTMKALRKLAFNRVFIKWGLKSLDILFNGKEANKKGKRELNGIIKIIKTVGTEENSEAIGSFMWMAFKLGATMFVIQNLIVPSLAILGIARIPIKMGLKSLDILFNGWTNVWEEDKSGLTTIIKNVVTKENRKAIGSFMWMTFKLGAAMYIIQKLVIPPLLILGAARPIIINGLKAFSIIIGGKEKGKVGKFLGLPDTPGIIDIFANPELSKDLLEILHNGIALISICGMFFAATVIVSSFALFAPILPISLLSVLMVNFVVNRILKTLTILEENKEKLESSVSLLPKILIPYTTVVSLLKVGKEITLKDIGIAFAIALAAPFITKGLLKVVKIASAMGATEMGITKLAVATPAYTAFLGLLNKAGETYNATNFETAHKLVKSSQPIIFTMVRIFKRLGRRIGYKSAILGSISLDLMATALISFSGSVAIMSNLLGKLDLEAVKRFVKLVAGMSALLIVIGLASPLILVGVGALFAMSAALIALAGAILILDIALLGFCATLVVFALTFALLQKVMPGDDVISQVVHASIILVKGISRIVNAIWTNLKLSTCIFGVIALALIDGLMIALIIAAVLFKAAANVTASITGDMSESILAFIDQINYIAHGIYNRLNAKELVLSCLAVIGYMILMAFLMITAILTIVFYGIISIIDFVQFENQLGLNDDIGFIPILGKIVNAIDKNISAKKIIKANIKMMALMGIIAVLNGVALAIRTLSSMEIKEFDANGKPTGETIKMSKSDFVAAANNATEMIKAIVGVFYNENGKETDLIKLLGKIDGDLNKKLKGIRLVIGTISKISKIIAKMSKLTVPDIDKGFDKDGKPLGWKQMSEDDIKKFKDNTLVLVSSIYSIFDDSTSEGGKLKATLDSVKLSMGIKMEIIKSIISTISGVSDIIIKMSSALVPDTTGDDWYDKKEGKIIKWRKLSKIDYQLADNRIFDIMTCLGTIIDNIPNKKLEEIKTKTLKKCELAFGMMTPISDFIDTIIKIGTGQFPMMILENGQVVIDEKTGQPKMKYTGFNEIPFTRVTENIKTIVWKYLEKVGGLFSSEKWQNRVKDLNKYMKEGLPVQGISDLIEHIIKIGTGQFPMMILNNAGEPIIDPITKQPKLKYVKIEDDIIQSATGQIAKIIESYITGLYNIVSSTPEAAMAFELKMSFIKKMFSGSDSIFSIVDPLLNSVTKFSTIKDKDVERFNTTLPNLVSSYNVALTFLDQEEFEKWKIISPQFKDFNATSRDLYSNLVNKDIPLNAEKTFSATQKLLDKINGTDPTKLGKMADISKNMATFATKINGNFDGLAKAMNENIITALDKVEKSMKELKEFLEDDFTNKLKTGMSDALSNTPIKVESQEPKTPNKADMVKDTHVERLPNNKQNPKEQQLQKDIKSLQQLISNINACISDSKINVTLG